MMLFALHVNAEDGFNPFWTAFDVVSADEAHAERILREFAKHAGFHIIQIDDIRRKSEAPPGAMPRLEHTVGKCYYSEEEAAHGEVKYYVRPFIFRLRRSLAWRRTIRSFNRSLSAY